MNGIRFRVDGAGVTIAADAILADGNDLAALKEDRNMIVGGVFACITILLTQNVGVEEFMKPGRKHLCHRWMFGPFVGRDRGHQILVAVVSGPAIVTRLLFAIIARLLFTVILFAIVFGPTVAAFI